MIEKTKKANNLSLKDINKVIIKGLEETEYANEIIKNFPVELQEKIKAGELEVEIELQLLKTKEDK